jgi:outer membrane protein OmpA-like peptidoglycan-associated protein
MRSFVTASLLSVALGCASERPAVAAAPTAGPGAILRGPELARVRCLLVAPFENGSDAPFAAEAATGAILGALDPSRTRVFPISELRAVFKDTPLELPQGLSPSLALELAEIVGADAALWGSVEGRSREGSPELLVSVRLGLAGDRRLLFADTGVAVPAGEKAEAAVRAAALDVVRPMLARLGDHAQKRCFDPDRARALRRLASGEEGGARLSGALAARALPAAAAPPSLRQLEWAKRLADGERVLLDEVAFSGRTAALQREGGLADLAAVVAARPELVVRLEGFVDATPDHAADERLSAAMAQAAGKRLVELGAPRQRVSWTGRGGDSPVLPNFTARGRAANRRIEVVAQR